MTQRLEKQAHYVLGLITGGPIRSAIQTQRWGKLHAHADRLVEALHDLLDLLEGDPSVEIATEVLTASERRGATMMRTRALALLKDHPQAATIVRSIRTEDPYGPPAPTSRRKPAPTRRKTPRSLSDYQV